MTEIQVSFDGSCLDNHKKNPYKGKCFGIFVVDGIEKILEVDATTNNQAEYEGLIAALEYIIKNTDINNNTYNIIGDSQVVIRQITGRYQIRSLELKKRFDKVIKLLDKIKYDINTVPREENPAGRVFERWFKTYKIIKSYGAFKEP